MTTKNASLIKQHDSLPRDTENKEDRSSQLVEEDEESVDSRDEALCDLLGISSLRVLSEAATDVAVRVEGEIQGTMEDYCPPRIPRDPHDKLPSDQEISADLVLQSSLQHLRDTYETNGVVTLPIRISDSFMRRITEELIWSNDENTTNCSHMSNHNNKNNVNNKGFPSDRTFETIRMVQTSSSASRGYEVQSPRRVLTRLEHFVHGHEAWMDLCRYLGQVLSVLCGEPMVLFKEKLNIKPPGGSGFAPHLDTPSLRLALGDDGPQTFVTVMVAIDAMTVANGCLRVVKGAYAEDNNGLDGNDAADDDDDDDKATAKTKTKKKTSKCVETVAPSPDGNPDADGRAGAIPTTVAETLNFESLPCPGGTVVAFSGWVPHRSAANASPFSRRAVFLTYNPVREGDCRVAYYHRMTEWRRQWQTSNNNDRSQTSDERTELDALATIPRI